MSAKTVSVKNTHRKIHIPSHVDKTTYLQQQLRVFIFPGEWEIYVSSADLFKILGYTYSGGRQSNQFDDQFCRFVKYTDGYRINNEPNTNVFKVVSLAGIAKFVTYSCKHIDQGSPFWRYFFSTLPNKYLPIAAELNQELSAKVC